MDWQAVKYVSSQPHLHLMIFLDKSVLKFISQNQTRFRMNAYFIISLFVFLVCVYGYIRMLSCLVRKSGFSANVCETMFKLIHFGMHDLSGPYWLSTDNRDFVYSIYLYQSIFYVPCYSKVFQ